MEIEVPPDPDELKRFIEGLGDLRKRCGGPSLRDLSRISVRVALQKPDWKPPTLSPTTVSDVLAGRRKRAPSWDWVACFVLSCLRFAGGSPCRPRPDEAATFEEWRQRWLRLHGTDDASPAPGRGELVPAEISELWKDHVDDGDRLSGAEVRALRRWGRLGVKLLRAAQVRGVPDAFLRLGVLACLDGHRPESLSWLEQAEAEGCPEARALIDHPTPLVLAVELAARFGGEVAAEADHDAAWIYLKRAASHRNAEAAFQLGEICLELSDPPLAMFWLDQAVRFGHRRAGALLAELHRQGRQTDSRLAAHARRNSDRWSERLDDDRPGRR